MPFSQMHAMAADIPMRNTRQYSTMMNGYNATPRSLVGSNQAVVQQMQVMQRQMMSMMRQGNQLCNAPSGEFPIELLAGPGAATSALVFPPPVADALLPPRTLPQQWADARITRTTPPGQAAASVAANPLAAAAAPFGQAIPLTGVAPLVAPPRIKIETSLRQESESGVKRPSTARMTTLTSMS